MKVIFIKTVFLLIICSYQSYGCPSLCSCKWKNGKQAVECKNRGLATIPSGIEHSTQVINLAGNNLQTLQRNVFRDRGLMNLQKLRISRCKIGRIYDEAFNELTNLVELDLSHNFLDHVPSMAFKYTTALRHLNLANNPLKVIQAQSFSNVPNLIYLDISSAEIYSISPLAFKLLSSLEKIHLENNNIKDVPESVIMDLDNIHGMKVHGNPWFCDCRALPLWRLLEVRRVPHPISPSCKAPRRVASTSFDQLNEDDFACPPRIRPVISVVEGVAGENATVTCPVEGQPPPDVLWYIGNRPVVNGSLIGLGPQRVYIVNGGKKNKISHLVITGAQEADSGQIRCIAVNPAGRATANFTLAVTMKAVSGDSLNSGHIVGITVGLIVLVASISAIVLILLHRNKQIEALEPPKDPTPAGSISCSPSEPNPIQKPPRLLDFNLSSSMNPDLISDAERHSRDFFQTGFYPNASSADIGNYTRMDGDSLYPSGMWDSRHPLYHEHYNPGFVSLETPHHTPVHMSKLDSDIIVNNLNYPSDFGLPIPALTNESIYGKHISENISGKSNEINQENIYISKEISDITEDIVKTYSAKSCDFSSDVSSFQEHMSNIRIITNRLEEELQLKEVNRLTPIQESGIGLPEASSIERSSWHGDRQITASGVPLGGVPVLPPLPNNVFPRMKSRDSPDEGYQEGTEV